MASPRRAISLRLAVRRTEARISGLLDAGDDAGTLTELGGAFLDLGEYLAELERFAQAVEPFDAAYRTLQRAGDGARAAHVGVRLAGVLMVLGRSEEALATIDAVITSGGKVKGAPEVIPMAHLWRVVALQELGRDEEALSRARRLVRRFGPGSSAFERQIVAKALLAESRLALSGGDGAGALRAANRLIHTYAEDPRADTQDLVAQARVAAESASAAVAQGGLAPRD